MIIRNQSAKSYIRHKRLPIVIHAVVFLAFIAVVALSAGCLQQFAISPIEAEERSVSFPEIKIHAKVLPDGSMDILEDHTVSFKGVFTKGKRWIPLQPGYELLDFQMSEGTNQYREEDADSASGRPGTYIVKREKDKVELDWFFETSGGERTFTIQYRVPGAVTAYKDVAELYWKFVGDETSEPVSHVSVTVELPLGADKDEIRAWGHGPLHGIVKIQDGSRVTSRVNDLPANTFVEARIAFPLRLVPEATRRVNRDGLPGILEEEGNWARQANIRRQRLRVDIFGLPVALLIPAGLWLIFVWRRYFKEYRPGFAGDYYRDLPADYTPAELGVLWNFGNPAPRDLVATIFDLARKGYIIIREIETTQKTLLGKSEKKNYLIEVTQKSNDDSKLAEHEKRVMVLLFRRMGENTGTLSFDQIKDYASKNAQEFRKVFSSWQETVRDVAGRHNFFDSPAAARGRAIGASVAVASMATGILLLMLKFFMSGIGALTMSIGLLIASFTSNRRSREGATQLAKWKAFRRFLVDFSSLHDAPVLSLAIWEHYLVYAITLGVAKKVIDQLKIIMPELSDVSRTAVPAWFILSRDGDFSSGFASLTESLESTMHAALSPSSSSSGGGGGFSSGGGGGGGGGGTSFS